MHSVAVIVTVSLRECESRDNPIIPLLPISLEHTHTVCDTESMSD